MDKLQKFIPLTKVEEQADGSLFVYGQVTAEVPDRDGEICKYAMTVPFYKAYNDEMRKATTEAGIEESIMPLREMHQLSAVGCGKSIDFQDEQKVIKMGFSVVDPTAINKVKKGVYTGFSQGGSYVRKWSAPFTDGKTYTWYVANPGEVSLVDSPCVPTSHFDYVKADGSTEMRKFAAPTQPLKKASKQSHVLDGLKTKEGAIKAFIVANATDGWDDTSLSLIRVALKAHNIQITDIAERLHKTLSYLEKASSNQPLEKGMYQVSNMAQILETLSYLQASAAWERENEKDASSQPEDLAELLSVAIRCFTAMVTEETNELASYAAAVSTATSKGVKAMTQDELNKASNDILEKAKGAKAHLVAMKAHVDHMHKTHKALCDTMHEHIGKCAKALGVQGEEFNTDGDGPTEAGHLQTETSMKVAKAAEFNFEKFAEEFMTKVQKAIDASQEATLTAIVTALVPEDGAVAKADGVGNRTLVLPTAKAPKATTIPVTKAQDNNAAPVADDNSTPLTREEVTKAMQGDEVLKLRLARQMKASNAEESTRLQHSVGMGMHR